MLSTLVNTFLLFTITSAKANEATEAMGKHHIEKVRWYLCDRSNIGELSIMSLLLNNDLRQDIAQYIKKEVRDENVRSQ